MKQPLRYELSQTCVNAVLEGRVLLDVAPLLDLGFKRACVFASTTVSAQSGS